MSTIHNPIISQDEVIRPTVVEIDTSRLCDNFDAIKKNVNGAAMMPVLKANAYGHGLIETAKLMEEKNANYLGVAVLEEGILLRENGIKTPILVLGGILGNQIPLFLKYELTITASSLSKLEQIDSAAKEFGVTAKVHLKIDTGMERIGVHYYNAKDFILSAEQFEHVLVEGIYSHFANADSSDLSHAKLQLERFNDVCKVYNENGLPLPKYKHMANSGGILQIPESHFNLVRPGILLYGVYPSGSVLKSIKVKPVLAWKSRVVYFKVIKPGHPVGYGSTWESKEMVRAVTVPLGYGDGYFRSMSHKAQVLINGKKFPVIGTISMDQIVVNINSDSSYNNDEVVLIGEQGDKSIAIEELADWAGTIPYEILTNINTRVPRLYI